MPPEDSASAAVGLKEPSGHASMHTRLPEPDRRSVAEPVDGVVVGRRGIPQDGAPEADIDRVGVCRDRELHLLCTRAFDDGPLRPRHRRDGSSKMDAPLP
jgi:hypothetical protein